MRVRVRDGVRDVLLVLLAVMLVVLLAVLLPVSDLVRERVHVADLRAVTDGDTVMLGVGR